MLGDSCWQLVLFCSQNHPQAPRQPVLSFICKHCSQGLFHGKPNRGFVSHWGGWNKCYVDWVAYTAGISFLTVLEAGKSEMKVLACSLSGENPLPDLQVSPFLLCAQPAERERVLWGLFLWGHQFCQILWPRLTLITNSKRSHIEG